MSNDKLAEALGFLDRVHRGLISGRISEWPGLREACGVVYAAHASEAVQAQSGDWVVVPREPTEWMLQAAEDAVNAAAHCESTTDDLSAIAYKAALAAAPQPQAGEPVAFRYLMKISAGAFAWSAWLPMDSINDRAFPGDKIEYAYTHPQPAQDAKDKESGR